MKIIRGIVTTVVHRNERFKLNAVSAQHMYDINDLYNAGLNPEDRVIGVVINDKLNLCYDIVLNNRNSAFGYFIEKNDTRFKLQLIEGFNKFQYNPYKNDYLLGQQISFNENEIKSILYSKIQS